MLSEFDGHSIKYLRLYKSAYSSTNKNNVVCTVCISASVTPSFDKINMFNRFLKNSDDLQAIVLYNELTDSVNGRHKFKSEKENGVRHIIYVLLVRTT
jgi:hypothetical protein